MLAPVWIVSGRSVERRVTRHGTPRIKASRNAGCLGDRQICPCHVKNVNKIPGLHAVTKNNHRLTLQTSVNEDGDHVAIGVISLIHAVNVEIAQARHLEPISWPYASDIFS